MKRLLATALIATALIFAFAAFAQDVIRFADALRAAPADANLVLISADGRIVGYSEDLSRAGLRVVLEEGFQGESVLLITSPDGTVTHEFRARVNDGGVVLVDGRAMAESLGEAGFGPPSFVTTGPPNDPSGGPGDAPGQAGERPDLPPQAGGAPGAGDASGASGGGPGGSPGEGGQGEGAAGGEADGDEDEVDDEEERGGRGGGPPDSAGPP